MNQETWEERFDQIYIGSSRTRIKDFIRIELQKAREEERRRACLISYEINPTEYHEKFVEKINQEDK